MIDMEQLRTFSALLGAVAFGLLTWRLITCWRELTVLTHILALLLGASLLIGAVGSAELAARDTPLTGAAVALLLHRLVAILVCIMWARWQSRHESPFARPV